MKLLIMSDNHGRWAKTNEIIESYRPHVDLILHCGDSEFPADDPIWDKVDVVVSGNMDFDPQYRKLAVFENGYGKFFLVHGHRHGVNFGCDEIIAEAKNLGAKYVFHGHTHKLYADMIDGIFIMNPGSLNHSRGPIRETTYALVDLGENEITVRFYNEDQVHLVDLDQVFEVQ